MVVGFPVKLNLIPAGVMPVVYINQGDTGYDKEFLIYNGDSPYNVPSGVSATIRGTKADNYGVTEAAAVTTGSNLVTVTITEQMVAAAGENVYELVFVDTDGLRVASINMVWAVKRDALGDSVISDSDLDYATQVMNTLQSVQAFKNQLDTNTDGLAAETAARIAADNALQANISSEASTRGAQDNLLQAQINQLVAPTGSAPSAAEVENARVGADGVTYQTLGEAIRTNDTELKNAIDSKMDGIFVDIANDKCLSGRSAGVQYSIAGNKFTFDGTATGGIRIKFSNDFDTSQSVEAEWRSESIGLVLGHKYLLCAEYVSGSGKITFVIYSDSGTGESIDVDSTNHSSHDLIYSNAFVANSTNARCLCAYYANGRVFSNLVVRFNFIDLTLGEDIVFDKLNIDHTLETNTIDLLYNKNAASGIVDFCSENNTLSYDGITVKAEGNKFTLNGTNSSTLRWKITNGMDVSTSVVNEWLNESLPIPEPTHKYVIAITKLSGSVTANKNDRVAYYKKDGTTGTPQVYFVTYETGYSTGISYSDVIKDANDIACILFYFPAGSAFSNVVLQINLIDITALETLNGFLPIQTLHDYYFDNDYLKNRMNVITVLRANASIHNASFLWFTDPHYFYPTSTVAQNGMQSIQLAEYLKKNLNNRYVICGGDLLRGTLTKDVCRDYLIKAREYMNPMYDDLFMCLGNHEYNNPGGATSQVVNELHSPELYEMLCKHQELIMDSVSEKADYSLIDKAQKVKYFVLGCDVAHDMFPETIAWLAGEMNNVENGYHVIIISHIGLTYGNLGENAIYENFYEVRDIIDAVNARGSFAYSGVTYNYNDVDFEIVCALTGHVHYDGHAYTPGGTPVIATICDRAFTGNDGDETLREVRKIGTIGEQALDYVLIDFDNRTIDMIRIGGSVLGASYDAETGKVYDTEVGTGTEYNGTEWVEYSPYKDRHFTY